MALLEEEVVVARVGQFEGHLRHVVVGFHHQVEVILLAGRCGQFGVDVELCLPLRCTDVFGQVYLIGVAVVGGFVVGDLMPIIACSEVVAKGI